MGYPKLRKGQEWEKLFRTEQWHVKATTTGTKTAVTSRTHMIAVVLVKCTTDGTLQIKSGSTVIWEIDLKADAVLPLQMANCPIRCNVGEDAIVAFSSGSGKVNFSGVTI